MRDFVKFIHIFDSRLNQEERHHQLGNDKSQLLLLKKKNL